MNGEVFFNMVERQHPQLGKSAFLLKRWKRHTIYSKSGSYIRTNLLRSGSYGWNGKENTADYPIDEAYNRSNIPHLGINFRDANPSEENTYQTCSVYLYDYIMVSDHFYYDHVYTASAIDSTPAKDVDYVGSLPTHTWKHYEGTWKNSPNAILNNYVWRYNPNSSQVSPSRPRYGDDPSIYVSPDPSYNALMRTPVNRDDGIYFEIVKGYPRNHWIYKRHLFSLYSMKTSGKLRRFSNGEFDTETGYYYRNRQTTTSTVGSDGLENGSPPVQSVQVGNLNLVQRGNVINY
jgi:hypothetical protein